MNSVVKKRMLEHFKIIHLNRSKMKLRKSEQSMRAGGRLLVVQEKYLQWALIGSKDLGSEWWNEEVMQVVKSCMVKC